jgi:hypothetical protein
MQDKIVRRLIIFKTEHSERQNYKERTNIYETSLIKESLRKQTDVNMELHRLQNTNIYATIR